MVPKRTETRTSVSHWEYLGLAIVLLFASALRLGWPGVNSFGFDEARVSLLALQMARLGQIPSVGIPSSAGVPNPPLFVWVMALPFALSRDPLLATQCVAALNALAVVPLWVMARRSWGPWAALTAGLLYASAPYGVLYSRSIWSQDLMAPLAILWAWLAWRAIERQSGLMLMFHVSLAGLAWQVHYSGAALIPATLLFILRFGLWRLPSKGAAWRWIVAGGVLPLAAAVPFAKALIQSDIVATSFETLLARPAVWSLDAWRLWAELGAGHAWEWLPLGWDWRWTPIESTAQAGVCLLTAALIMAGLLVACGRVWRSHRRHEQMSSLDGLALVWALATPVLFLRSSTPVYHQYMLCALPALALLASRLAYAPTRRWQGPAVLVVACAIALVQGNAVSTSIRANATELHLGGMGTPLRYPRNAANLLRDGTPVYTHARSDAAEYDADAAAMSVLLWDTSHRVVNGESVLLLPPAGQSAHLVFMFPDSNALSVARQVARIEAEREFARRTGEPPYTVLDVSGLAPQSMSAAQGETLDNGLTLLGWRANRVGDSLRILTFWQVLDTFAPGRYHQFNHLYADGGQTHISVQDAGLSSGAWEPGNLVVSWATFATSERGSYYVDIGIYAYPELTRVPLSAGGDCIRLGPFP